MEKKTRRPAPPKPDMNRPENGTERWPARTVGKGQFIQVPKVLLTRFSKFGLEPRHLWLILMLQSSRYRNRAPRYYWAELADAAGKGPSTVRKWAYELKAMGLLRIRPMRALSPGDTARPGYRNERNQFFLDDFEKRVGKEHDAWKAEQASRRVRRTEVQQ